jgi:tetratricopeptide (TPR) repeat protein
MRDFEAFYTTELQEEEIAPHVAQLEPQAQLEPITGRTAKEIETLFEYLQGLIMLNRHVEASAAFNALRLIIDDFREKHPNDDQGFDYFYEWSLLALRLTPESRSEFVSLPLYRELFATFDNGPVKHRYRGVQARAQLTRHYDFWLGTKNGNPDLLEEDDRAFILAAREEYDALSEAAIEEVLEREDHVAAVRLLRNAAQFYLMQKRPNDAIASLKEALEYLPLTPKYHETDSADLQMQLGQIFMGYGKFEVAKRYFAQALETYTAGGEQFEMLMFQAEGWVEEAERRMKVK